MRALQLKSWLNSLSMAMAIAAIPFVVSAAEPGLAGDLPARQVTVAFQFPGITLTPEDSINVDLLVKNRGRSDETVLIEVTEKPADWEVQLKRYSTLVNGVFVGSKEDQTLNVTAKPASKDAKKLPPGKYQFAVRAQTADGALTQNAAIAVEVVGEQKATQRVTIETTYPELRGPSGDKFQFSLEVRNDTDEDAVFNFRATTPKGWEASFKPAYEQKQISSLQINANQSKTIEMEVTPPYNAEAGEYDFHVVVQSPKAKAEKALKVILTGTYSLQAGTPNSLLSVVTERAQPATVSLLVQNRGSAVQREVNLTSFKPENWKVEFKPQKIENLDPGAVKQVEMTITPAEQSLIGDYSVNVQIEGEKSHDDLEFRVTVRAAPTWGWIGVGIIVLVVLGLTVMFRILGRR